MDEENNLMEEGAVIEDLSDGEFSCGDPQVEPRVGDEFQVEIPPMMSASKREVFLSTPLALDDSSYSFVVGRPVQVMWIEKHQKGQANGDENVDMSQSLRSFKAKRSAKIRGESEKNLESKKQRLNLEAVPAIPSSSWEDFEVDSFVLGLYTFGKNFKQVSKFMEKKGTGEILLFYYGKFYNSAKYHRWSSSRKKRNRKCVTGKKLYSGWRQQQLLSRLVPSIPDESKKDMLVNVSKSFAEENITLESYISAVKDLVGLKLLVGAVAIGKDKEDLTVLTAAPMKTKSWFTVSPKTSSIPGLGAYSSLTSADIINQLTGCSRLSKARCNDIFWEAVWPRLLARGWHSEQIKDRGYFSSKDNIVFIVPGVKRFSRGKLVKGEHYFDSVSDILTKVASEPEILEFETGGEIKEAVTNELNSCDQSDEESSPSDSKRHCYLKSPCSSNRGTQRMKFTVVDTSLSAGGKLCDLRNLNEESLVSEAKTHLGEKHSSIDIQKVEKSQMMPLDTKNQVDNPMRFTIIDTSMDRRDKLSGVRRLRHLPGDDTTRGYVKADSDVKKEETLEKVKHKRTRRAGTNHHSVDSAPFLKRRKLSACIRKDTSLTGEGPVVKPLLGDEMKSTVCPESDQLSLCVELPNSTCEVMNEDKESIKSDQSEKTVTGLSSSIVEIQEMSEIKPNGLDSISGVDKNFSPEKIRTANELISSEQELNRPCSVSGSDYKHVSVDLEQEQAVKLSSISGSKINTSPSNEMRTTQERGSSEQQLNTDGPRRQSTRKRPLTTRALEALESGFLTTTKRTKSTITPRKRESCTRKRNSAKVCNRAQVLSDKKSAGLEHRGEEDRSRSVKIATASKPLDQLEDSKPSFRLNEATTETKALDRIQEHPKLPPIVLKLSLKRR